MHFANDRESHFAFGCKASGPLRCAEIISSIDLENPIKALLARGGGIGPGGDNAGGEDIRAERGPDA